MRKALITLIFISIAYQAHSETPASRYYCKDEVGGGIRYDENLKRYVGTRFVTEDSFILSLERDKEFNEDNKKYNVRITKSGSSIKYPCHNYTSKGLTPTLMPSNTLQCHAALHKYIFDFSTNKYLTIYTFGYIDDEKNSANTPSIVGGICTSIE